jgi:hypothetical protein
VHLFISAVAVGTRTSAPVRRSSQHPQHRADRATAAASTYVILFAAIVGVLVLRER